METKRYLIWETGNAGVGGQRAVAIPATNARSAVISYTKHFTTGVSQDLCAVCTTDVNDSWQGTAKAPVVELTERGA